MTRKRVSRGRRQREGGVAAIIAMMFLVIFSSLAAAMAIVAQSNLSTADTHIKVNRSLAAAETGMRFIIYRLEQVTAAVQTRDGVIDDANAPALWDQTRALMLESFTNDVHSIDPPVERGDVLEVGPIAAGPNAPTFTATFTPHPITGEDYDSDYYQRPPYSDMTPPVAQGAPLGKTWIRVQVNAADGPAGRQVNRSIQMDFKIDKKIRFAILSKSRIMIGRNVMIEGPIGSRFTDTHLTDGHPIQMLSDFQGLHPDLDTDLGALIGTLILNDRDGDNRLNLSNPAEIDGIEDPQDMDTNGDGFVDDYDFFLAHYDVNADGDLTALEMGTERNIYTDQLLELIDTFGDPNRPGYNDGVINADDRYAKIRGNVKLTADMEGWNDGAAGGTYQDYFNGPIQPHHTDAPLTFEADDADVDAYEPSDFDVSDFQSMASGDFQAQAEEQEASHDPEDPESPQPLGNTVREEVPYGAAHPYDYYTRPVFENMIFTNVSIPKGTNALFRNCRFIGVTYIETETDNADPAYNLAGTEEADGSPKHPDEVADVGGQPIPNTKTISNNIRFHNCTFEGMVVSGGSDASQPAGFTHVRNKLGFTGSTQFEIDESTNLSDTEKELFKRSTILTPHYSIEMGTFVDAGNAAETLELSGMIVTGVLDIRGRVEINGTILTTFDPVNGEGPVLGDTSPQFNATIGYFDAASGDLESEMPETGIGLIKLRYDPTLPLPDGILGPISIDPNVGTYFEGGAV